MATQDFETLRARVQALGCQLFIDNADDGDPRYYIHSPRVGKHVLVGVTANEVEDWCADLEPAERDRQTARGLVPAEGTKDGENGHYFEPSMSERRAAIVKTGDAPRAISHAMGALQAIHGLGRILQQDAIRDDDDWVLAIAHMIVEESERMNEFLDRPGGWSQGGAS